MAYTVSLLTSEADCDELLEQNADELRTLRHRAASYDYERENSTDNAAEVAVELTEVESKITVLTTSLASLAEGELKRKWTRDLEIATARRNTLRYRQSTHGVVAVLLRERELAQVNVQIAEAEAFKAAVEARKAQL